MTTEVCLAGFDNDGLMDASLVARRPASNAMDVRLCVTSGHNPVGSKYSMDRFAL